MNIVMCFFHNDRRPVLLESRSSNWFITATVCTAIFTDVFLYAVIVPVFPFSLRTRIGVPENEVQHWLSVLMAVWGAGLLVGAPISGFIADRVRYRRWPLLVGLVAILSSTVLLCLAKTLTLLILGRLLQGLSASIIWVVGLALLADTVGSDGIAVALGYVGTGYSLGTLVAPLLGGIVYQHGGYYAVFAMTFGVVALDVFLRLALIEKKQANKWLEMDGEDREGEEDEDEENRNDDLGRHVEQLQMKDLQAVASVPTTAATNVDLERNKTSLNIPPTGTHTPSKVPPILSLLSSRQILTAFWSTLVVSSVTTGLDTTLTLFVNRTFGWNSSAAGILFLAPLLPSFFGPLFGKHVDKHGARWIVAFGFLIMVPFFVLLRLVDHNGINQKALLVALLVLIGFGIACAMTGVMAEFTKVLDVKERANPGIFGKGGAYAQSYGIFNVGWAAGSLIGAFWGGGIYNAADWGTVAWSWALLCGVSALPVLLFTDGWIGSGRQVAERRESQQP